MKFLLVFNMLCVIHLSFAANNREKRLVLHSETDMASEMLILAADIAELKTENIVLNETFLVDKKYQQTEITRLTLANTELSKSLNTVKHSLDSVRLITTKQQASSESHESVYIRSGRTVCTGNGSTLVYKGYMAGSNFREVGDGTNHLCLPDNPTLAKYDDAANYVKRSRIYGTEYEEYNQKYFGKHVQQENVPCAVCQPPRMTLMVPARVICYPGWDLEYTGYLMSQRPDEAPSEYVCVDANPEAIAGGHANTDRHLIYLVESRCGTLSCPPYVNNRELACVVCSKKVSLNLHNFIFRQTD